MKEENENELNTPETPQTDPEGDNSLEVSSGNDSSLEAAPETADGSSTPPTHEPELPKRKFTNNARVRGVLNQLNIYLALFLVVIGLSIGAIVYGIQRNSQNDKALESASLTEEELADLRGTDARVGDPRQTLGIESNAIFSGKVLVRDNLDVAGNLQVGGRLNIPGISVSGSSTFDAIQANQLDVNGDATLQGQLNIQEGLNVTGGASFGGTISAPQLNIQNLQLSGDLQLNRHIDAGGGTPGKNNGSALGSGGTSSINGTDTAGTVTINTGSGASAGCYISVTFVQQFNATPHVVITPVGSAGASLNYYVNRSTTGFSVCSANAPGSGVSFSFDYIAID